MNRVETAIILAAGKGERLRPVTAKTPKPLVSVKGIRIIDTIIRGLLLNDINNIIVVVGYLKEKFKILKETFPCIQLIENPNYKIHNNISSLYFARDYISNSMIIDGDQIINNIKVLNPEFESSGYSACYTNTLTDEWLLRVENGIIKDCNKNGGQKGWQLYGISRWTREDGIKLKNHLEEEYINKNNTNIYWDDVALFCHPEEYELKITEIGKTDITEIDNLSELIAMDGSYERFLQ